jgi:Domain of unknown function (DUF4174)
MIVPPKGGGRTEGNADADRGQETKGNGRQKAGGQAAAQVGVRLRFCRRFEVFLVGKDGHTAVYSDKPLSADDLFARVDAMPMRQDEMRRGR